MFNPKTQTHQLLALGVASVMMLGGLLGAQAQAAPVAPSVAAKPAVAQPAVNKSASNKLIAHKIHMNREFKKGHNPKRKSHLLSCRRRRGGHHFA